MRGAYALWGLTPFLRLYRAAHLKLEPLVLGDPSLQRMLVSIVLRPSKNPGVNVEGAPDASQPHARTGTQAQICECVKPGAGAIFWVPAGRHNRTGMLPRG